VLVKRLEISAALQGRDSKTCEVIDGVCKESVKEPYWIVSYSVSASAIRDPSA
jgi:hypothetical protein